MIEPESQLDLFDQLSYYEGADVEYKSAKGGLPGSLWETYSAFANSNGGVIWLGVSQRDGRLVPSGVSEPEKLRADFWSAVNNRGKISANLLTEADVSIIRVPESGTHLIRIRVGRASRRQRPVHVGPTPLGGTFRRNSEGDFRCTDEEVRRMFADSHDEPPDSRIVHGFSWSDLHAESIQQFRNRFLSTNPEHAWSALDDQAFLGKLGAWRVDRASGESGLTLAGLLMLGKVEAIRAPEGVPRFQLDYRERFSADPAVRWTSRLTIDGTWEANLFQFYLRVITSLGNSPAIKKPFKLDADGYRQSFTPVHEALREALVNALIHGDYGGEGGVVIDHYLDRIEFSNPGTLLVSREQLLRGGVSECRNKSLQLMFRMMGAGDQAGSGIDKIRKSWADQHWRSPRLGESLRPDRVQLTLPMVSTLPDEVVARLGSRFGAVFHSLGADEVQALAVAEIEGEITNQRLQEMLALHRVDITRMLRGLVRQGLLAADGVGRGTRYFPVEGGSGSPGMDLDSPGKPPSSPVKDPELLALAHPVRSVRRAKPDVVIQTVLRLCGGRYLTLRDLAALLNRHAATLRDDYLKDLVASQKLELRYPEAPNRPDQAYKSR